MNEVDVVLTWIDRLLIFFRRGDVHYSIDMRTQFEQLVTANMNTSIYFHILILNLQSRYI